MSSVDMSKEASTLGAAKECEFQPELYMPEEPSAPSAPPEYDVQSELIADTSPLILDGSINNTTTIGTPLSVQIQSGLIFEDKKHCCCFKRPVHQCCAILSLFLWTSIVGYLVNILILHDYDYYYIPIICCSIYTIEVLFCKTSRYLWNLNIVEDVVTYVNRIKATRPVITLHCECSHKEPRTKIVTRTYYDSNGQRQTETIVENHWEKVVTYRGSHNITYHRFEDASGQVTDQILQCNAVRIDYTKSWSCGDQITQALINGQIANFHACNRCRDQDYDHWTTFDILGFKGAMVSITNLEKRPLALRWLAYVAISLFLGASWPYRLWFCRKTAKGRFHFTKVIYCYPQFHPELNRYM